MSISQEDVEKVAKRHLCTLGSLLVGGGRQPEYETVELWVGGEMKVRVNDTGATLSGKDFHPLDPQDEQEADLVQMVQTSAANVDERRALQLREPVSGSSQRLDDVGCERDGHHRSRA